MRALALLLVACAGKHPADTDPTGTTPTGTPTDGDADTDADSDADSDTDADTDATPTGDTAAGRDGTWSGDLTITAGEGGFAYFSGTCTAPLVVTIAAGDVPQVAGSATCAFADPLGGTMTIELAGDLSADPALSGTGRVVRGDVDQSGPLTGGFSGADTLQVGFAGDYQYGEYSLTWDASGTLTRQ